MNKDQWEMIEQHFDALRDASAGDRAAALAGIEDEDVRREVHSLLDHSRDGETLAAAVGAAAATVKTDGFEERRVGPYKIVRRVGHGGQGAVFEAARDDGSFHQRVAVKIVKWEIDSDLARERFLQERQILAGLEHPYIARLVDGGQTDDGVPYLVMEFVEGQPLTVAAADWPLRKKLELFLKVCEALAYAHRNLVIHRDLKPANILVTAAGDPKVLDFGIAKLIDPGATKTQTGLAALTPDYASPEQVRGLPISTASDVYSLGVVLYQLLTSRKPYTVDTSSPLEMDRVICEQPPAPPAIGDELDHILLMALRKEPERRYRSVEQFAEDIGRYLSDQPVRARPDTIGYRARKFVRRNWWQIAAVAAIILSLSAGLGFVMAEQRRTSRRFNQVRQLANKFLFEFHDEIANTPGTVKARGMIVATALEYLNSLSADAAKDPGLQWELAVAYGKVALAQGSTTTPSLMQPQAAVASLEKAIALARPLADQNRLDIGQRSAFVKLLNQAEQTLRALSEYDKAIGLGREAVERSAGLPALEQAAALNEMATTLGRAYDLTGSLSMRKRVLPMVRERAQRDPTYQNRLALANVLVNLGYFQARLTEFDEALANGTEGLAILRSLAADRPGDPKLVGQTFLALYDLGLTEGAGERPSLGKVPEAMQRYREALSAIETLIAADPHDNQSRTNAGLLYTQMEITLAESSPRQALQYANLAASLLDAASPGDARTRTAPRIWAIDAHRQLGQLAEAERSLEEARGLRKGAEVFNEGDLELAWARLEAAGEHREAAATHIERALVAYEKNLADAPIPANAWVLTQALDIASKSLPASAHSRRERILAVWTDQNRRFPGHRYLESRVAEAEAALNRR